MRNIIGYLKQYGGVSLTEKPFNDVDGLVLSAMSYLMFDGLVPSLKEGGAAVAIERMTSEYVLNKLLVNTLDYKRNRRLWRRLIASERFGGMRLNFYRSMFDPDEVVQFSAVTCFLPDGSVHICFRGTDLTLVGWKEDFNMSCTEEVPAQKLAVEYVQQVAALTEGPILISGHSKGGNLAYYAATFCEKTVQDRIAAVYNYDGQGFSTDIFSGPEFARLEGRVHKCVPHDSMIGLLMYHTDTYKVVKCRGVGILQHDPYHWYIGRDGEFLRTKKTTYGAKIFEAAIRDWMESLQGEDRENFIDQLFFILGADDGICVIDYLKQPVRNLKHAKRRYRAMEENRREFFSRNLKNFLRYRKENAKAIRTEQRRVLKRRSAACKSGKETA